MAEALAAEPGYSLPRDTLLVRGPDRKTWLDGLVTCAVSGVSPGAAAYGLLLTKQGKIVSDVFLADSGSELFVGVAPRRGAEVSQLLDRFLVMEDAELELPAVPPVWLLAPAAPLAEAPASSLARGALQLGALSATLCVVPAPAAAARDAEALPAWLAEHGLGVFDVDFSQRDNPHEASLDRVAVSWTKGCYLGQEVVCMQDMRGKVKRRLVALDAGSGLLEAASGRGPAGLDVVASDGSVVGHVTSLHRSAAGGTRALASISALAIDSPAGLTVLGEPVRVAPGPS